MLKIKYLKKKNVGENFYKIMNVQVDKKRRLNGMSALLLQVFFPFFAFKYTTCNL